MKKLTWLTALCAVLVATPVYPQERLGDMYAGAALGMVLYSELKERIRNVEDELHQEEILDFFNLSLSTDDRGYAWSAFAGYHLNDDFAIEVGYLGRDEVNLRSDLKLDLTETIEGFEESLDFKVEDEVKVRIRRWSLYGALVRQVSIDFASVTPFVKIGVRRWDGVIEATVTGKITLANSLVSETENIIDDDNGFGLLLGGGLDVPVNDAASLRVEYLYLPLSEDHGGDEHRAYLGAYYSF